MKLEKRRNKNGVVMNEDRIRQMIREEIEKYFIELIKAAQKG